jgi:hypothetical protein
MQGQLSQPLPRHQVTKPGTARERRRRSFFRTPLGRKRTANPQLCGDAGARFGGRGGTARGCGAIATGFKVTITGFGL